MAKLFTIRITDKDSITRDIDITVGLLMIHLHGVAGEELEAFYNGDVVVNSIGQQVQLTNTYNLIQGTL